MIISNYLPQTLCTTTSIISLHVVDLETSDENITVQLSEIKLYINNYIIRCIALAAFASIIKCTTLVVTSPRSNIFIIRYILYARLTCDTFRGITSLFFLSCLNNYSISIAIFILPEGAKILRSLNFAS